MPDAIQELFEEVRRVERDHPLRSIPGITIGVERVKRIWERTRPPPPDWSLMELAGSGGVRYARDSWRRFEQWHEGLVALLEATDSTEPAGTLLGIPAYVVSGDVLIVEEPATPRYAPPLRYAPLLDPEGGG